eukprot:TRINITY_DN2802_c1_g2_i1.p2 TRINITY_DN2802_c1_g2~~TRINITY_DN2802_c1_g2_i1.p2  ORF type:complete len:351 (+),score=119.39 TRINITY_DN2802_c1_g2_i1:22-1053(+)
MLPPPVLLATASYDRTIRFWEAPSGICMRTLNFQDSQVNCMCTSPDKTFLAAAGHKYIRLYELGASSQVPASTIEAHSANVTGLVYFRNERFLISSSEDGTIKIWDTRVMFCKREFAVKAPVNSIALHPDQFTILSGDQTGRLCVWEARSGDAQGTGCVQELVPGGDAGIRSVTISQDPVSQGSLVCAANNAGDVFILSLTAETPPQSPASERLKEGPQARLKLVHTFKAHNKYILRCVLSPDGMLLATCSADYTIGLWHTSLNTSGNVKPWSLYKYLQGHQRWVWDCAFSGDGKHLISASSDNTGKLWDIAKGVDLVIFNGHHKPVTCIAVDDRMTGTSEGA